MDRRAFVRLMGGGAIGAAGAPLAGCANAVPPEALQAWQGPGHEPDLRRWILSYAVLAPHSHNLQSWLVDLRTPDEIVLRCDLQRLLPETDPQSRQIMMSQGTFIELLDLAARERGQRAQVSLFPEGAPGPDRPDGRPVARIRLQPDATVARDPLFAQILRRRTNRNPYEPRDVAADVRRTLAAAVAPHTLSFGFIGAEAVQGLAAHRTLANQAWRIEVTTPRTLFESIKLLRVGGREIAQHRDGLTITSPMLVALDRLGLFDRSRPPAPDSRAVKGQIDDFEQKAAATPAFLWLGSQGNDRVTQVNAGRAWARVQLAGTAAGLAMQPVSQALQEYPEMAGPYDQVHRLLQLPRPQHTVQMWARVGYAAPVEPAPRRGLQAHLQPQA